MRIFKKAIASSLAFLVIFCLFSSVFILASDRREKFKSAVSVSRDAVLSLPEDTNYLFCGASHCAMGIVPDEIDKAMGVKSYNLSVQALKLYGRYELLKNTLGVYPVDTVVLEISYDCLGLPESQGRGGDFYMFQSFRNYLSRGFLLTHPLFITEFLSTLQDNFNKTMSDGLIHVLQKIRGAQEQQTYQMLAINKGENRGFEAFPSESVERSKEELANSFAAEDINYQIRSRNLNALIKCINLCHHFGANVKIIVTPISDSFLWEHSGWNEFYNALSEIANQNDCEFYDFNLLRERYQVFNDNKSFYNDMHLSESGAIQLSKVFAEVATVASSGKKPYNYFYSSYDEMIQQSPYWHTVGNN